jgi:hypothetical protein
LRPRGAELARAVFARKKLDAHAYARNRSG